MSYSRPNGTTAGCSSSSHQFPMTGTIVRATILVTGGIRIVAAGRRSDHDRRRVIGRRPVGRRRRGACNRADGHARRDRGAWIIGTSGTAVIDSPRRRPIHRPAMTPRGSRRRPDRGPPCCRLDRAPPRRPSDRDRRRRRPDHEPRPSRTPPTRAIPQKPRSGSPGSAVSWLGSLRFGRRAVSGRLQFNLCRACRAAGRRIRHRMDGPRNSSRKTPRQRSAGPARSDR